MTSYVLDLGDLAPIEVQVNLGGKAYILREATGDVAVRYRNQVLKAAKPGMDGKPTTFGEGLPDVEPYLVSMCLYEWSADNKHKAVGLPLIRSWPNRIQKALFDEVKRISQLDADDTIDSLEKQRKEIEQKIQTLHEGESPGKNSLRATTSGSE